MSGGHFGYDQYRIDAIADEVERLIESNEDTRFYSAETITEFRKGVHILRVAAIYAQRIDWLVSCDDGEESFLRRLAGDLSKLEGAGDSRDAARYRA